MSLIVGLDLAKQYGAQDVFDGLSFEVPREAHIGLVGPNGSGKTTLLRIIAGLDQPSGGRVRRARGLRIGYMPQQAGLEGEGTLWAAMEAVFTPLLSQARQLRELEAAMTDPVRRDEAMARYGPLLEAFELAGGYDYPTRIEQVLSGLGFTADDFHQPLAHLSGGQRTRALLARLLLENPDLLLLDEPTNHLDLEGIEWLEGYLKAWRGAMVVVAHDRAFLDQVTDRVWELASGRLATYRGNYSRYVIQRAEQLARQQALYERQQEQIAKTEEYIRRYMAGQRTSQAQDRVKRLQRMERIERPRETRAMRIDLGRPLRSGDLVLGLYRLTVGYDSAAPLFSVDEVELRRGQRAALLGPNGSGKTTLLRTILGEVPPLDGRVRLGAGVHPGYFAQAHAGLDPEKPVLDTILEAGLSSVSRARNLLGRYHFSGDEVFKRVGNLSGGEQARVALAVLAMQGANFLLLDEPTNHLDIPSQEVLQEVLSTFEGTVLLVSHDRYLVRALATHVWAIADGELQVLGGYEAYQKAERERRSRPAADGKAKSTARQAWDERRTAERAARREAEQRARQRAAAEAAIQELEERLEQLEGELAAASTAREVERVAELGAEHSRLRAELDAQYAAWEELA